VSTKPQKRSDEGNQGRARQKHTGNRPIGTYSTTFDHLSWGSFNIETKTAHLKNVCSNTKTGGGGCLNESKSPHEISKSRGKGHEKCGWIQPISKRVRGKRKTRKNLNLGETTQSTAGHLRRRRRLWCNPSGHKLNSTEEEAPDKRKFVKSRKHGKLGRKISPTRGGWGEGYNDVTASHAQKQKPKKKKKKKKNKHTKKTGKNNWRHVDRKHERRCGTGVRKTKG